MSPARAPRRDRRQTRLLRIDPSRDRFEDGVIGDLAIALAPGDVVVLNDAATLPASIHAKTDAGAPIEIRLAGANEDGSWRAIVFGAGDWHTPTEHRAPPPRLAIGDMLNAGALRATIIAIDANTPRLVSLSFTPHGDAFWPAFYTVARPVQYAYSSGPLALWDVQTHYAAVPSCSEAPSAGFALTWELLLALRRRGITIARVSHAAGLSSSGDDALDARLPLAEAFTIPRETALAITLAKERGARVVAVGTTSARALEGAAAAHGRVVAGRGVTDLLLGPRTSRRVVDAIVTGVHDVATSHFTLLESFALRPLLERAHAFAESRGYLGHEFGDAVLILSSG